MRRRMSVVLAVFMLLGLMAPAASLAAPDLYDNPTTTIFINEIHYDNTGTDAGEAIEVVGPAGTDLTGWSIVLYNGANGLSYDSDALGASFPILAAATVS